MKINRIYAVVLFAFTVLLSCCNDPWGEYIEEGHSLVNQKLLDRLASEDNASIFLSLLAEAELSNVLDGRNAYTVFAPSNESLLAIESSLRDDKDALRIFVQNHIAVSTHRLNTSQDTIQLTMLNGKILDMVSSRIGGVPFVKINQGGTDGLYHVLAGPLLPQQNLWEFINSDADYEQNKFIVGLNNYNLFMHGTEEDPTDSLLNNEFLQGLGDVRVEKQRFTYFVLDNSNFETEVANFLPYVNFHNEADSSKQISRYHVVRDLIFSQAYDKESLPAELISISGVKFPVDKSAIVESIQLSNGYVHVLNSSTLPTRNKLLPLTVEGEQPTSFSNNVTSATFHRVRRDPTGELFRDIMVQYHGVSMLRINYDLPNFYSTSYDVYWRGLNDLQANVFQQRLNILGEGILQVDGTIFRPVLHEFPYTNVEINNYDEIYLGTFELAEFRKIRAQLMSATSTSNGANTLVLDFLRFVPKVK